MMTFHERMYQDAPWKMHGRMYDRIHFAHLEPDLNSLWHIENVLVDPKRVKR